MSQQINLFNPALIKQKSFFSGTNLLIGLALSLMLLLCTFAYVRWQLTHIKKMSEQSTMQLNALTEQVNSLRNTQAPQLKNPALQQELTMLETAMMRRHQIAQILQNNEFGNTDGYSDYLVAFARQIPANVWLTGFTLEGAGYDLTLHGRALQAEAIPLYVTQLKREKIMQGKTFSTLQMDRPLLPVPASEIAVDPKKIPESAPYLEFELHSSEPQQKPITTGGKTP